MAFPISDITITEQGTVTPVLVRVPDGSMARWVCTGFNAGPSSLGSSFPVAA